MTRTRLSTFVSLCALAVPMLTAAIAAATPAVRGRIVDADGLPLPGVSVVLTPDSGVVIGARPLALVTDAQGTFDADVPPGRYTLRADLSGFEPAQRSIAVTGGDTVVVTLTLALARFEAQVTVTADAPRQLVGDVAPDAPVAVTREVVDSAMLPNSQYDDVLPLMPNVVRGPDGLISVAGARAPQGALVVDGFNESDPVSGQAGMMLPLEAIDSMQVYAGGYPAAFGRAAGGVTSVATRAGANQLHMSANSFFPRMLFQNGGIRGVEYWEPNAGASGPIVKDRAFFEEAISLRFDRNTFGTLAGDQTNRFDALMSWTRADVALSSAQRLVATVAVDPQRTNYANITAFTPVTSAPRLDQGGWSAGLADRFTLAGGGTVEVRAAAVESDTLVAPNGSSVDFVGHEVTTGSYFDSRDLRGRRVEGAAVASWPISRAQELTAGATLGRATLAGTDARAPVDMLRSDGSVAEAITFGAGGAVAASTSEVAAFVQDAWTAARWLTIDGGIRVDRVGAAATTTVSPRVAFTADLSDVARGVSRAPAGRPGKTTLSGSVGVYADKLVLGALGFAELPSRAIQAFDASGAPIGWPLVFDNALAGPLTTPSALRWDLEIDHDFAEGLVARVKYQARTGRHELVVDPVVTASGQSLLMLDSTGSSEARSLETTVGYRAPRAGHEIYVSYVHASARGDLNSFDAIEGTFAEPFVQPNQVGPLPADVPDRLLAWGLLRAPGRITVAPFVEVRSGFPYSAVDDEWRFVRARDGYRLPWFGSLDLYVNKIVGLPGRLPDARVGLKLYNVASVHTARDVQRDIARPDFGATYNPIPRDFTMVFELLWGH